MTSSDTPAIARRATGRGGRRTWNAAAGVAVVALVAGLAIGRFLTFAPAPAAPAPPVAALSLADRMSQLERQVAQDPSDVDAWQLLGATAVQRAFETADPAFYDVAEGAFDRADELEPDALQTLVGRGALALSLHDFDRALVLGRQAVQRLPSNAQALGIVVDAQVELGQYDAAADTLQQMLDVRPDLPALARASYLRQLHGDLEGAQQAMRQAELAGSPSLFDQAAVVTLQGDLMLAGGDVDAASDAYRRAFELAPTFVDAVVGVARVEAVSGQRDAAVTRLVDLVDRVPSPAAAALLAQLQGAGGDAEAAGDTVDIVRSLAVLQEAQGQVVDLEMAVFEADQAEQPRRAVQLARSAYDARPDNVFTADALGWALHRAGESREAVPFAEQATRLGTADPLLHYHAAQIYAGAGLDRRAAAALQTTLDLTPWFSLGAIPDAKRLAQRLDVPAPPQWGAW